MNVLKSSVSLSRAAFLALLLTFTTVALARAERIELTLREVSLTPYVAELLEKALMAEGHEVAITRIEMAPLRYANMVSSGEPSLIAFKNRRRTIENALRIDVPLTGGLIGKRVVFVRPEEQERFAEVHTLEDLRANGAVAAFGEGWYDARVWAQNELAFEVQPGKWRQIYPKLASGTRGIDYFSRGILEMSVEAREHPDLAVDPYLLLTYPGDFSLFLSANLAEQAPLIQTALEAAVESGLRDMLLRKYFSAVYDPAQLNMAGRRVIELTPPP